MADSAIEAYIRESSRVKLTLLDHLPTLNEIVDTLCRVVEAGGTIYACGNGGSTCDAMHLVEELVARYSKKERPGIRAQHLCDPSVLTCWSNDCGFETVFKRQVETFVTKLDALVAFTTSGNSKNVLAAIRAANEKGATTIALLGNTGGEAKKLAQIPLTVSAPTQHAQECHIAIVHMICDRLEARLFRD